MMITTLSIISNLPSSVETWVFRLLILFE
jgi:hypothetical protein